MENRICFTCTCLRSKETILSFKPLFKEGFGGVEMFYPYNMEQSKKDEYKEAVKELIKDEDITMVMHLPHGKTSDLSRDDDKEYEKEVFQRYLDAIDYGKEFGVERYTLHLGVRSINGHNNSIDGLIEKVKKLCDRAYPAKIMIENMPSNFEFGAYSDELRFLFNKINKPNLRLIYDTGHGHVAMKSTVLEKKLLDDFKDELYHFHINDNDTTRDMHGKIGSGTVEFEKIFKDLKKNNYQGLFCLEILFSTVDDLREYANSLKSILNKLDI